MSVKKAVIPAAGLGTRFLPATKTMPKEMLPIVDKPVLQYVVEEALASGIDDILIVTFRGPPVSWSTLKRMTPPSVPSAMRLRTGSASSGVRPRNPTTSI